MAAMLANNRRPKRGGTREAVVDTIESAMTDSSVSVVRPATSIDKRDSRDKRWLKEVLMRRGAATLLSRVRLRRASSRTAGRGLPGCLALGGSASKPGSETGSSPFGRERVGGRRADLDEPGSPSTPATGSASAAGCDESGALPSGDVMSWPD